MAYQPVNVGTVADDGTGDPLRTAFQKTNANDVELYAALGGSPLPVGGSAVYGPATATSGNVALFDGVSGKLVKDGGTLGSGAFATAYVLPAATNMVLGGVKPDGTTITNAAGAISVTYPLTAAPGSAAYTSASDYVTAVAGATANHVAFFSGATGKVIADSGLTLSGSNTGDQTKVANLIGGAAGSLPYQTGADTTTLLAAGAANLGLFMNSAGTAPAWGVTAKIITSTITTSNASASVSYTGVGFKPSVVIAMGIVNVSTEVSIGFADASTQRNLSQNPLGINWQYDATLLWLKESVGNDYDGTLTSMDADGFTISWVKTGSPTATALLFFLCFR